jgi:ribosomal protein L7Ae-like RNA K-turn-binding protein
MTLQNRQKALNLLGLAERAGKLVTGQEIVTIGLKAKKIKIVILASDIQPDTSEKVKKVARKNEVKVISNFTSNELSHAIGKKRKVLGITDTGFGKALVQKIHEGV